MTSKTKTVAMRGHTGPAWVKQNADKLRAAGVHVANEGTEHVYVTVEVAWDASDDQTRADLAKIANIPWRKV